MRLPPDRCRRAQSNRPIAIDHACPSRPARTIAAAPNEQPAAAWLLRPHTDKFAEINPPMARIPRNRPPTVPSTAERLPVPVARPDQPAISLLHHDARTLPVHPGRSRLTVRGSDGSRLFQHGLVRMSFVP